MKKTLYSVLASALPVVALAQGMPPAANPSLNPGTPGTFVHYLAWFGELLATYVIPIIITLALILFLWGLISYITAGADEEKRSTARNYMIYGIIALFVMVSVWGLVAILNRTFGVGQGGAPTALPEGPLI